MATITLTIPDNKLAEFKSAYLRQHPIPLDPVTDLPTMTELAWIKQCIMQGIIADYRIGKQLLAEDSIVLGADLIS